MPKNMIFRLGVDASDFTQKMAKAGSDAESAGKRIKKTMTMNLGSDVATIMGWKGTSAGITGTINTGNFDAAKSQLSILKSYRGQLADAGFDDYQFGLVSERIKVLEFELNKYEDTLKRTAAAEQEAARAADDLGDETRKAEIPVTKASDKLRDMGNSGRRLSIVPGFLRNIRSSANGSNSSLEKMVRTIRNVSVVSFGLRLVKGMFGELGSIVRQYISENAALQAQVNGLKSALGQALAPAINVVTNALTMAMPYVVGFSNAVGSLITSLFGSGWTTVAADANTAATAIGAAGSAQKEFNRQLAGFDEITKLSAESAGGVGGGGVGGSGASSSIPAVEPKTPTWLTDLTKQVEEAAATGDFSGIGKAVADAINKSIDEINLSPTSLGSKLSEWFNKGISTLEGFVANFDWSGLGDSIATNVSDFFNGIDWAAAFQLIGASLGGIGTMLWSAISDSVESTRQFFEQRIEDAGGDVVTGILNGIGQGLKNIGTWIADNVFSPFVDGFKSVFKIHSPSTHKDITSLGENIIAGIFGGITSALSNVGSWIKDNIFTPISKGLSSAFGEDGLFADFTVNVQAKLTSWKDSLVNKVVSFQSNLTTWKDSLANKAVDFQANMSTWQDSLGEKIIDFKANVTKGWLGNLAEYLGIGTITTKLQVDVPTVSVTWSNALAPNGNARVLKPQYSVAYNELGAIFSKSTLLGHADGKWQIGGEAGREVLLNVDRHTWWMDLIADKVVARTGGGSLGEDQNITVNLVVDGKVLTSTVVRNVNAQARATGRNPLAAYI